MSAQSAFLALTGLYFITGIVVCAELSITPGSVRRHYETVALTDEETAVHLRKYPRLCAAAIIFVYLLGLVPWPLTAWAVVTKDRRP
ncbi:hypothetical protein [Streptomyces tendae]|uniref:hypothetical protein n=1 Tax=Streptomyces tendae TaxID=1932 RepID=UPI0038103E76